MTPATRDRLREEVGYYLGYGRDYDAMDDDQQGDVDSCINSGEANFYHPKLLQGDSVAHRWSFLEPIGRITLVASQREYTMPEDFATLSGNMVFQTSVNVQHVIQKVGIGDVNERWERASTLTGRPTLVAIVPQRATGVMGQRFSAFFYPVPNEALTVSFRYAVLPAALTTANPLPYGGMAHAETLLESCLAVAESRIQDERGLHQQAFEDRLRASIAVDLRGGPDNLGYNGDGPTGWAPRRQQGYATYNGVLYSR